MEKIVVVSGGSVHENHLIECLRALFPECVIDIQPRKRMSGKRSYEYEEDMFDQNLERFVYHS